MGVLALLATATVTRAQDFDYDPQRPAELRPCDTHLTHGRATEARTCYQRLLTKSKDPATKAEAAWATGNVRQANDLFRQATGSNDKAVRPRVRWARLYLATHQYTDAAALFQEALAINENDGQAKLGLANLLSERFEGEARKLVTELLENDDKRTPPNRLLEAHLLSARMDLDEARYDSAEHSLNTAIEIAGQQTQPPLEAYELLAALDLLKGATTASP
ncbi:MAG: tetratricopeptide repeat protein, partial [Gammaproteobacteria bacterium]